MCSRPGGIISLADDHGCGLLIMEKITITTQYDIDSLEKQGEYIAGMNGGNRETLAVKK
jgi:hypothetical protein